MKKLMLIVGLIVLLMDLGFSEYDSLQNEAVSFAADRLNAMDAQVK